MTMVLVPAGSTEGDLDEQPVHEQHFDMPFWIDKYEVTRAHYQVCVAAGACEETSPSQYSTEDNQPINRVTWFQAHDHCEARGARLPTEAEWEYAARGPDGLVYPWGNEYDASKVIGADDPTYGDKKVAPVGSRPEGASWVGAMDMSGNLWEWTSSLYKDYPYSADSEDDSNNSNKRVLRGGSFGNTSGDLRGAYRSWFVPSYVNDFYIGVRCARSSP